MIRLDRSTITEELALAVAWAFAAKGDLPAARARLVPALAGIRRRLDAAPTHAFLWSLLGQMEALLGNEQEARRTAQKAVDLMPESRDAIDGPAFAHHLAVVRAWTGDKAGAIAEFARLLQVPGTCLSQNWPVTVHLMRHDPRYLPLRGDPQWEALLNDAKNDAPLF
jgi:Flp pilus assembly protein TadD